MIISVFTPTHNTRYLAEAYQSLVAQTFTNWEWVVLLNGDATLSDGFPLDERVRVLEAPDGVKGIGALKQYACAACTGEILVELDHDDLLHVDALWHIAAAFDKNPHIGFVYSDTVRFCDSGAKPVQFDAAYGWEKLNKVGIAGLNRMGWLVRAFDPTPQSLARIWYAPDHVRAWRRTVYEAVGGHDPKLEVCDDYDLLLRTYLATDFVHIKHPLYAYRFGAHNTTKEAATLLKIQNEQFRLGNKYRVEIAEAWARRKGLMLLDICSGPEPADGYCGVDKNFGGSKCAEGLVTRCDLAEDWWAFADDEVGVMRAQDALEHLPDKLRTMSEAYRVLAHGGWLFSDTPSADGRGAFQDPTHVSYWNSNSFWYWTSEAQRKFLPDYPHVPHFQMWHVENLYYNDWYRMHDIPYVRAHMSAIKQGPRLAGPYDFSLF